MPGSQKRGQEIRQQYAEWLQGYNWDYLATITFRSPRREPYYALKHTWGELGKHNVARAFLGVEPHQSGDLHIHGLLAGCPPGWRPEIDLPWQIWDGLFHRFGRARVEACNTREAVTAYCSKYILKEQSRVADYYGVYGSRLSWQGGELNDPGLVMTSQDGVGVEILLN
ncbi:hypothetical protein ES703_81630 [subsurface metagenome]